MPIRPTDEGDQQSRKMIADRRKPALPGGAFLPGPVANDWAPAALLQAATIWGLTTTNPKGSTE